MRQEIIRQTAAVAAAYALIGLAAVQLSVPPAYAAPVYPSAGLAIAAAYVYGAPAVAGAAIGSLLVNALVRAFDDQFSGIQIAVPLATAAGAALQAGFGGALLRRYGGPALRLETPAEYLRFGLLGGPLACLVGASTAVLAFWASGTVPAADLPRTWWTWWTGDVIGVLIAAPIVLALVAEPRALWAPRRRAVALPLVVALLLVGAGTAQVARWQRERVDSQFRQQATAVANDLKQGFGGHLAALHAIHALFEASEEVTPAEFRRATAHWLRALPSLQALGWSARVAAGQHAAFEQRMRADGDDYRLFDRGADGSRRPSPPEREVIALAYIEPRAGNEAARGVNALSVPPAAAAIDRAAAAGSPQASAGFRLTQEAGEQTGVVVYLTVRRQAGSSGPIDGVVFATMRMDDAVRAATDLENGLLSACVVDVSDAMPRWLAGGPDCAAAAAGQRLLQVPLLFAGRQWQLQIRAGDDFAARHQDWTAWWFAVMALAATGLLGAFLLLASARTQRIRELVDERTAALRREVAERKDKEQALLAAERRFRDVFEAASVGLAYTDLEGCFVRVNARFCEIAGRTAAELEGRPAAGIVAGEDAAAGAAALRELVDGRCSRQRLRQTYLRPDGLRIPVEVTVSLSRDAGGRPLHVVKVVEDLRERLAREAAEASNRAKTEFLSRMSHELRTPLNAMLGFAQVMQLDREAPLPPAQRERVEHIGRAGWHLLQMINDVLDLSRIEAGALPLALQPLDLRPLAQECASMHEALARSHAVALAVAIADDARHVAADATRLRQVLSNLLSNAIKYNRQGGLVELRSERGDGEVLIRVEDSGTGLTAAQIDQLFQPFNRAGREGGDIEGTGIGLVIARHLVGLMKGRIEVASTPGAGSTFTVALPAAAPPVPPSPAPPPAAPVAAAARRIVYIEDNAVNVEVVRGMLQLAAQPLQLEAHERGADGLRAVLEQPPDLLLLDLNLPDMAGLDVLRRLRGQARLARLPIVVMSADAMDDQVQQGLDAGADAYLTKPIQFDEFTALIGRLLGPR